MGNDTAPLKLTGPQRRALETIAQAHPYTVTVLEDWSRGWCRERVTVPQSQPRITAHTYAWLRDHGLVQEEHAPRFPLSGRYRRKRFVSCTAAGHALLNTAPPAAGNEAPPKAQLPPPAPAPQPDGRPRRP